MIYNLDGNEYEVIIVKKNNKNTYIRVKSDLKIYVTTNYFVTKRQIISLLDESCSYLRKAIDKQRKLLEKSDQFFYLGKSYDIIYLSTLKKIDIDEDNHIIYVKDDKMLNRWLNKQIVTIFQEEFDDCFGFFDECMKKPILKIRKMKSRWGVYNRMNHSVTLNSHLIEYDLSKLEYVIYHELSHTVHFDHSKSFWKLVSKYCPKYKEIKKGLKE